MRKDRVINLALEAFERAAVEAKLPPANRAGAQREGKILISRAELAAMPEESFEALVKMTAMRPDTKLFVYGEAANENTETLEAREQNLKFKNVRFVHEIPALNNNEQVVFLTDQALPSAAQGKFKKLLLQRAHKPTLPWGFGMPKAVTRLMFFEMVKGALLPPQAPLLFLPLF